MPEVKGPGYRVTYLVLGDEVAATIMVRRRLLERSPEFTLAEGLFDVAEALDKEALKCHED